MMLYQDSAQLLQPHVYEAAPELSPSSLELHEPLAPSPFLPASLHRKITTASFLSFV